MFQSKHGKQIWLILNNLRLWITEAKQNLKWLKIKKKIAGQGLIWYPLMKRDICIKLLFKESLQLSFSFRLHWFLNVLFFPWP